MKSFFYLVYNGLSHPTTPLVSLLQLMKYSLLKLVLDGKQFRRMRKCVVDGRSSLLALLSELSAFGKMVQNDLMSCNLAVPKNLYGYRLHLPTSGFSPYELIYRVVSQISLESVRNERMEHPAADRRRVEALELISAHAIHIRKSLAIRAVVRPSHIFNID